MDSDHLSASPSEILQIPIAVEAVAIVYNVPTISPAAPIRLSGRNIADIYIGRIKTWNDPDIAIENPDISLPDQDIIPVHRMDETGTTFVFTDFLGRTYSASRKPNQINEILTVNYVLVRFRDWCFPITDNH